MKRLAQYGVLLVVAALTVSIARAQVATGVATCTASLNDGGGLACSSPVASNYAPVTATCQVVADGGSGNGSGVSGQIFWEVSNDGVHYGSLGNGDAGLGTFSAGLSHSSATVSLSGVLSPDPWPYVNLQTVATPVDGGTSVTCVVGALNQQHPY